MPSRHDDPARVFMGNLPHDARERDIERFFDRYGRVKNIFIKNGKYGFCEFDDYRDADDAVHDLNGSSLLGERITVEHAKGPRRSNRDYGGGGGGGRGRDGGRDSRDGGRRAWIDKYGPPTRTNYRVIVENLSSKVSWQDLKDLMRRSGEVTFADAHKDKKNEGVVEFASRRDMERAIEKYDDYDLEGRRLKLVEDKRSRSRSRSRSPKRSGHSRSRSRDRRSRSGSRSRSRSRDDKEGRRSRSKSRSRSRSRSGSKDRSRSRSKSRGRMEDDRDDGGRRSRSRSKSRSRDRDEGDENGRVEPEPEKHPRDEDAEDMAEKRSDD